MTLATTKKSAPLSTPTIKKERAEELTAEIFDLGDKIGQHLAEIRDSRGFQHLGYRDFVTYCKTEFGYGKSRAYQLIQEAQIEETLRKDSIISESERLTSSHYSALANDVAPENRGKVLSYAKQLAEMRGKNLTAIDIKAAAITVNGGVPNRQSKWVKPLSKLGFEKGVDVVINAGLPTSRTGIIKKVHQDGRIDVQLYGFNTPIPYSLSELELAAPRTHIPLSPEECSLNQEVLVFSSRMNLSGAIGIILGRLKEIAIVEIDKRQYELRYEELAAVEEEEDAEASEMTVEVESEAVEVEEGGDDFNWTDWTRKWLPRMLDWLAANATDRQRLDIFSALAEKLSAEGREAAIAIFGGMADGNELAAYKFLSGQKIETLEREVASQNKQIGVKLAENYQLALKLKEKQEEYYALEKELKSLRQDVEQVQNQTLRIEQLVSPDNKDSEQEIPALSKIEVGDRVEVIQPEGWCEIAYANPGQRGVVQGKHHKKGGYNILLDEPPAQGKRQDITLPEIRLKKLEPTTSINQVDDLQTTELAQQITEQRQKLAENKSQLEQDLKNLEKEKEPKTNSESKTSKKKGPSKADRRKKIEKDLANIEQRVEHLALFETYTIGDTVQNNGQEGIIKNLNFSLGGMPQAWVEWEGSGIVKAESISTISQPKNIQPQRTNIHDTGIDKWQQIEEFQKQLIPYVAKNGAKNPYAYSDTICKKILNGESSPLFDDFLAGRPLGSQVKRDWEIAPGTNYPAFEEERIQYFIHKGEPVEQATLKAREELRNPTTAQDLWDGFLRKSDRIADDAIKAKELGVENPYLPPSFTERETVTKEGVFEKLISLDSPQEVLPVEIPSIETLRKDHKKPASKALAEKAIKENPDWGYNLSDLEAS